MGIKRQKASAIMQSLLIDLAATGSFEALAIIKKAWAWEGPLENTNDALGELKNAAKRATALVAMLDSATKEEAIDQTWSPSATSMMNDTESMVVDIEKSIGLASSTSDYWNTTGTSLLQDICSRLKTLITSARSLGEKFKARRNIDSTGFATKAGKMFSFIQGFELYLTDALDEIENAMEALNVDPSADPAAAPADAPPGASANASATSEGGYSNPSLAAYNRHILGGKKALEDFFTRYKVEADPKAYGFNRPAHEIVKKHILDNKDIKSLMIHADKHDKPESLKQLLNISKFAAAAEALRRAVDTQIKTASSELDALPPVLPGV